MPSPTNHTSWAPTSNLQRKLPTSGGVPATAGTPPPAVRDVPYVPAPRDTPDTAEERPPCDRILDASPPRALFPSPHPQQTTQNHSFRAGPKRSWTKRSKYEYCYHFSSRQNHPKWRPGGSARPFQLTRMAGLGLGAPLLMNRFFDMFIIFLVVNTIIQATVLIFGIFCPLAYYQPPITGKKQAATHGGGLFGVQKRR